MKLAPPIPPNPLDSPSLPVPPTPCSVQIIPTPNTFVISNRSVDGCIQTDIDPTMMDYDPQNDEFHPTPDQFHVDADGCLDSTLRADRMRIPGKCRLCNSCVDSYNADLHLLECSKIDNEVIDNFARDYASETNSSYSDIINVVYDYCSCIMNDDEISSYFCNIPLFANFLYKLESILDSYATYVFLKSNLSGPRTRFNILNYSS